MKGGDNMHTRKITAVMIDHAAYSKSVVNVDFKGTGAWEVLFGFFPDEITVDPDELLGLTADEARRVFFLKDRAFLGG
jgi:hypothetical protein